MPHTHRDVTEPTDNWPEYGDLDGKQIKLGEIDKLPMALRTQVVVDVPGEGKIRPWRFASDGDDVRIDVTDGTLVIL